MANSRLERIGSVYSRARGLIESGAKTWNDRPLWYDIYEAFPPKEEPLYHRPVNNIPVKEIFYEEDKIRALLHNNIKAVGVINLNNPKTKTFTQRFIDAYKKIETQYVGENVTEEKLFSETLEMLKKERVEDEHVQLKAPDTLKKQEEGPSKEQLLQIQIKDLFKE